MSAEPNDSSIFVSQEQIQQLVDGLSKAVCAELQHVIRLELPLAIKCEGSFTSHSRKDHVHDRERDSIYSVDPAIHSTAVADSQQEPLVLRGRYLANRNHIVKTYKDFQHHHHEAVPDDRKSVRSREKDRVSLSLKRHEKKASNPSIPGTVALPGTVAADTAVLHEAATANDKPSTLPRMLSTVRDTENYLSQGQVDSGSGEKFDEKRRTLRSKKSSKGTNPWGEIRVVALPQRSLDEQDADGHLKRSHMVQDKIKAVCLPIVKHRWFSVTTIILITVNACTIGLNTDWAARNLEEETNTVYDFFEMFFCISFSMELVVRIGAFQLSFFWPLEGDEKEEENVWQWNWFDGFLVLAQIIELSIAAAVGNRDKNMGVNISFMRVLRVLRVVRVVRLVRIVHLISELRTIIASILGSLKSLGFTILIIVFLIYIMAVFLTQVVTDVLRDNTENLVMIAALHEFFDSVPLACLTLFQSMTNGVDWASVVKPLIDHVSPLMAVVFSIFIAFTNFAMLNVITGVFVESAITNDSAEKDTTMVARLYEFLCKSNVDGILTWEDFEASLDDPAIQLYFKTVDLDVAEARNLFLLLDVDGNGAVETGEFVTGCLRLKGDAKAIDLATLMYDNRRWQSNYFKALTEFKANVLTMLHSIISLHEDGRISEVLKSSSEQRMGDSAKRLRFGSVDDSAIRPLVRSSSDRSLESKRNSQVPNETRESAPNEIKYPSVSNYPSCEYVYSEGKHLSSDSISEC